MPKTGTAIADGEANGGGVMRAFGEDSLRGSWFVC